MAGASGAEEVAGEQASSRIPAEAGKTAVDRSPRGATCPDRVHAKGRRAGEALRAGEQAGLRIPAGAGRTAVNQSPRGMAPRG